ncbi:MAG: RNA polymerase sigma factor [Pirellulaceae bacterium]
MDEGCLQSRLSRISTIWDLVAAARGTSPLGSADPWLPLIQRYQGAAYRYLLGAVRNPSTADELFQEFALRCVQGSYRRADPARGRFRDYLRTVLVHLVVDHQRKQRNSPKSLTVDFPQPFVEHDPPNEAEEQFLRSWRNDLLARAWAVLAEAEQRGGQPVHSVLKFRAENPSVGSAAMASRLSAMLQPPSPFTESGIRKILQRARAKFADALVEEVAHSLGDCTTDDLEQELIDVGLLPYCRAAVARRRGGR